jgi:hypothetical protein
LFTIGRKYSKSLQKDYGLLANGCDVLMEHQDLEYSNRTFKFQEKIDMFEESSLACGKGKQRLSSMVWLGF